MEGFKHKDMLAIIDIPYKVCCDFYKKKETDIFKISGIFLLCLAIEMNFLFLLLYSSENYNWFERNEIYEYRYLLVILSGILFFSLLYIRYFKVINYEIINKQFHKMSNMKQGVYYLLSLSYIILSIFMTVGYAIFLGTK